MPRTDLRDLALPALEALVAEKLGAPRFRAQQIYRWIHGHGATSSEVMTDITKELRDRVSELGDLSPLAIDELQISADGTRKLRMRTHDDRLIETVLIPDGDKITQCISSQVGCALDCTFCATATLGYGRNLTAGEIVDQVYRGQAMAREVYAENGGRITNIVYMGMGEPLHNYDNVVKSVRLLMHPWGLKLSSRRITISTAGMVPQIEKLGTEDFQVNLAISLNASDDRSRNEVMPINKKYPIAKLLGAVRGFPLNKRRRVTFEYVLLKGVNDTAADAERVATLLHGIPTKVNLIPWNPHPLAPYQRPEREDVIAFQDRLRARGFAVYIRKTRGDDIDAACGQLAAKDKAPEVPAGARRPAALALLGQS